MQGKDILIVVVTSVLCSLLCFCIMMGVMLPDAQATVVPATGVPATGLGAQATGLGAQATGLGAVRINAVLNEVSATITEMSKFSNGVTANLALQAVLNERYDARISALERGK